MLLNIIATTFLFASVNCKISEPESRIVNGTNAAAGEYPFMVSIRRFGSHFCGGTIVNKYYVLTAAHCLDGLNAGQISVQYGVNYIDNTSTDNVINAKKIIMHENYSPPNNYANDIAVLELTDTFNFTEIVQPVTLPKQNQEILFRTPAIVMGWGYEKSGGSVQKELQKVDIFAYTALECMRDHGTKVNTLIQMCAGIPEGGKGQCSGDSGGPLIVRGFQAGIVSWSVKPCTIKGYPGVFAKVSQYVDWINSKTVI